MTTGTTDEKSTLDDVFSKSSDMGADTAAPGAPVTDAPAEQPPAPEQIVKADEVDDDASLQGRDPRTGRFVPVTELVETRKKLKGELSTERDLRLQAEANAKAYKDQIESFQRQLVQQPRAQQQPHVPEPEIPDPVLDPEGYNRFQSNLIEQRILDQRVNTSEMLARDKFGDELVDKAAEAAKRARVAHHFINTRHPVAACVEWYKKTLEAEEIGGNLEAFKKRIADQAVQAALAQLKAGGQPQGQPQPAARFPGTLADQTATGTQGAVLTEATAIQDVFANDRRRA